MGKPTENIALRECYPLALSTGRQPSQQSRVSLSLGLMGKSMAAVERFMEKWLLKSSAHRLKCALHALHPSRFQGRKTGTRENGRAGDPMGLERRQPHLGHVGNIPQTYGCLID